MAVPGVTLVHVLVAFVLGFALAYLLKRETYDRFPSPLGSPRPDMPPVYPGADIPSMVQGRDFIPKAATPTPPPGPAVPEDSDTEWGLYGTAPPSGTFTQFTAPPSSALSKTQADFPAAQTFDTKLSFIAP